MEYHQYSDQDHALIHVDDVDINNNNSTNNKLSSSSLSSVIIVDNNNTNTNNNISNNDINDEDDVDDDDDDENDCVADENNNINNTTNKNNTNKVNNNDKIKIKKVRFPDDNDADNTTSTLLATLLATIVATIPSRDDITPEEYDILYFTKNEYQICRSECKLASRDASRSGFGYQCLTNTFIEKPSSKEKEKSITTNPEVTQKVIITPAISKKKGDSKKKTSTKNQINDTTSTTTTKNDTTSTTNINNNIIEIIERKLCRWTCELDTKRGLERWCDKEHGDIRQREQFQAIMNVLEAQDDLISSMNYSNNNKTSSNKKDGSIMIDIADKLRRISYKSTKASRYYARMIGKADSFAVLHLDCNDPTTLFSDIDNHTITTTTSTSSQNNNNNHNKKHISDNSSVDTNDFGDDYSFVVGADEIEKSNNKKKKSPFRRFRFTKKDNSSPSTSSSKK